MENKQVKIIKPKPKFMVDENGEQVLKLKRVCAYCRVSTDNDEQKTSVDYQIDEYTKRIQLNPDWVFAGIFADEGISGTSTKNRKQFNEMINLARSKKIDLILTKSISRFTRNTVDCLNYIRELRAIGVEIYFEKENIYSSDSKVDFLLTIMSSIAQEEARNTSENVKWTVQKRFKEGVPIVNTQRFLGYTKDKKGGQLVIVPEEAKIVKELFALYIGGVGPAEIRRIFEAKGYKTGAGKTKWLGTTINDMLKNEKYCGGLLLQKTVSLDYLSHKRVANRDLAPMYHIENSHEPIVDKETFLLARQIMKDRANVKAGEDKNLAKYTRRYPLSGIVICGNCGHALKRRYWNYGKDSNKVVVLCGGYVNSGKTKCKAKGIESSIIEQTAIEVINKVFLSEFDIMKDIYKAVLSSVNIVETDTRMDVLTKSINEIEIKINELVDMKLNNELNKDVFNNKYQILSEDLRNKEKELKNLEKEKSSNFDKNSRIEKMKTIIKESKGITTLEIDVLRAFIYRIIAVNKNNLIFCVSTNRAYTDTEFNEKLEDFIKYLAIAEGKLLNEKKERTMNYRVISI